MAVEPEADLERPSSRVNILGVGVTPTDLEGALARIAGWISRGRRAYVCVGTVHGIMECRRSPELRAVYNAAGMVTTDGMPLVWLSRWSGRREARRVYGPDLMLAEMAASAQEGGHRHFLYGGGPGVAARLGAEMERRFPGVRIAGTLSPEFGPVEQLATPEVAAAIDGAAADVVWVGLSTPKQDRWMAAIRPLLRAPVLIGVGAAFDFHTGNVRQAPGFLQRAGLEWLYRLIQEPRRLWRRYLVDNPWFLFEVALQKLGLRGYPLG